MGQCIFTAYFDISAFVQQNCILNSMNDECNMFYNKPIDYQQGVSVGSTEPLNL